MIDDNKVREFCDELLEENARLKVEVDRLEKLLSRSKHCAMCECNRKLDKEKENENRNKRNTRKT